MGKESEVMRYVNEIDVYATAAQRRQDEIFTRRELEKLQRRREEVSYKENEVKENEFASLGPHDSRFNIRSLNPVLCILALLITVVMRLEKSHNFKTRTHEVQG